MKEALLLTHTTELQPLTTVYANILFCKTFAITIRSQGKAHVQLKQHQRNLYVHVQKLKRNYLYLVDSTEYHSTLVKLGPICTVSRRLKVQIACKIQTNLGASLPRRKHEEMGP